MGALATRFRNSVSHALHGLGLVTGSSGALAQRMPVRRILMLHGIADGELSATDFERNLRWLRDRFRIVPLGTLIQAVQDASPPRRDIALTFDDGLDNHFSAAYPILQKLQIPATFFVCPDLMERNVWLWNHEVRARLKTLPHAAFHAFCRGIDAAPTDAETLVAWMKSLTLVQRQGIEAEVRQATPAFTPTAEDRQRFDLMRPEQLRALDPTLITVGSHTLTHPILPGLDDASLAREVSRSREQLEQQLDRVVDLFCYPNGANDVRVRAAVARSYRAAVATQSGFVDAATRDLFCLPRISMPASTATLAWRLWR